MHVIDPVCDLRWMRYLEGHPQSSVFHSSAWLKALSRTYGYSALAFVDGSPGSQISGAAVFCVVDSWLTGKRFVSLPFSDHAHPLLPESDFPNFFRDLQQHCVSVGCKYIELRPIQDADFKKLGFTSTDHFYLHTINLERSLPAIYNSFHRDCVQRRIRRAEREHLTYLEGRSESFIEQFYHLLLLTHFRHHRPTQPISWFRNLADCLGERFKIRIAFKDGRPIASILTLSHKQTMIYKYGCSDTKYHNLGGVPLLLWRSIEEAKNDDLRTFDMGRTDLDNFGLISFKERWGAERRNLNYWRHSNQYQSHSGWEKFKMTRKMLQLAPSFALQLAGKLLYKHMA